MGGCRNISRPVPFLIMSSKFEHFDDPDPADSSDAQRNAVNLVAGLRLAVGQKFMVSVVDLSAIGFRIETGNHIELGSKVYLAIPGLNSLPAVIIWSRNPFYGCAFLHPLYPAVFEHIAGKYSVIAL